MKKIFPYIYIFILVAIDQLIKFLCLIKLKHLGSITIIKDFFYLTYVENRGAAFGIFEGARFIFVLIGIIAIIFCMIYYNNVSKNEHSFTILWKISLIIIPAGAIGNIIDRVFRRYVIDMFHFNFFGKDFAVFNFADILICTGVFLLSICIIFSKDKK